MRKIKFCGVTAKELKWIYGDLIHNGEKYEIREGNGDVRDVIPESVGEFSGLHDNDGTEIYEGDIVEVKTLNGKRIFPVVMEAGIFGIGDSSVPTPLSIHERKKGTGRGYIKVLGHVFDTGIRD